MQPGTLHLASLEFYGGALHVSARVARLTAANVANSDTPNYKARGIDFDQALTAALAGKANVPAEFVRGLPTGLDGNDVSLDYESIQAAANGQRLRESLTFLNSHVQDLITALQPNNGVRGV